MKQRIGNRVLELRIKDDKTQEQVAKAVGVSRQTIISIEKGNYTPSVLLALRIARFFRKSVEEVFIYKYEK